MVVVTGGWVTVWPGSVTVVVDPGGTVTMVVVAGTVVVTGGTGTVAVIPVEIVSAGRVPET
jgi:hypothetical protein